MTNRVLLIHGFNVKDGGAKTIDTLRPMLEAEGYEVEDFDYGFLGLIMVRFRTGFISKMLAKFSKPDDRIIGHSHGCAITAKALENGAQFKKIVFIHPALNNEWEIPNEDSTQGITVYYSTKDVATWGAKLLRWISPMRFFGKKHFWGAMGSTGSKSKDPRWTNINDKHSHSGIFRDLDSWGHSILDAIE